MIKTPKISIYITNRNYGKYIDRAIKSVLSQTFMEYELIIVDDASDDNSLKIIKKYIVNKLKYQQVNNKQVNM